MASRQVRRTQSAPHLTLERRRVHMALVEGTLYIRRRHATSQENGLIAEEEEEEVEEVEVETRKAKGRKAKNPLLSSIDSVSSLVSDGSSGGSVAKETKEVNRRVRILTSPHGKKGGLRASQSYNSQSSLSADCESITASEVLRRRQQRKDFNKRHTLVGIENAEDLENLQFSPQTTSSGKVKESPVIMDYLKKKYPEHAERIDGRTSGSVMSNGFYETDLDNTDTMSEINTEATGFSRGGRLRSSMPVVRSVVNKTKEKPLGLIFLQYKNETKRALMPNEVTGIDTVRALYVRAFPKQLTMAMLEQPARKIYIMDPTTDIFYELENTDEIIDRTVLKIYEPGFVEDPNAPGPSSPRSTTSTPVELDYYSEPEVDHQKKDVRKNRYNTMTLPRSGAGSLQPDGGARQQAAMGNLNPSQDRKHTGSLENFRRGTPERASATLQRPVAQNQAFQRLAPERATLSGPVQRGPGPGHGPGPQGPYGRRGPPPNQQGSATMPRRMPQHDPHHGLGPRPQGSATIPRSQKGGGPTMVDGRPSGGDMRRLDVTPVSKRPQPQVMSAPMPNGHPRQRGPPPQQHPHHQTPPGRPMGPHGTLPRNGAPGMRHPMPNGTGPGPGHPRGQAPLRRHGSHDGTFQDRPHSAPSVDEVLGIRAGGHQAGPQRPYSQPAPLPPMRSHSMEENTNERISAMEQQIANLAGMVRSVIGTRNGSPRKGPPPQQDGQRPAADHRPAPPVRADAMPITQQPRTPTHQPPLHSRTPEGHSRTPDGHLRPSSHPGAPTSPRGPGVNLQRSAMVMKHRVTDLRMQLKQVRKMHLNMVQQMNNNFKSTSHKIRMALEGAPGSDIHPIRNERAKVHQDYLRYLQTQETIERELRELDENVEKLRDHTINKRGNVNLEEIDLLAQSLGNSSRRIAEQKVNFPVLAEKLKTVQEGEMEIVVREENWMKHEPQRLDDHFKRCKKVTSTLYTLKRMAATHDEPYVISPTSASVSPSSTLTSKHVVRVDTAPYPQSAVVQRQTILDDEAEPVVRHDLPHRFKSPLERDLFEQTLSETKGALRQTHNVDANTVRHRRTLRELFDQENHDTMTPIITPEKAAKREAQKEAAATGASNQKKGPPPPPPPRKHFPASPVPEQSNKKITWSSTQTTPTNKKTKLKSPPPVAAKPQSMKTTTRTTTTTTTTRSAYQVEDVNQALDELESLAFKATDTEDPLDSQAIKDSSPSSPNGTIQKPVHAHIRLPQSPSRSFATKPKPLSPRGDKSTTPGKVGGKTSAFVPIKATGPSPKKKEIKPSQQTPPASSSSSSAATSSPSPQQPLATSTPAGKTSSTPADPSVSSPTAKVEEAKPLNVSTEMKPVEPSTVSITLCSKQVTSRSSQEQKGTVVVKEMTTSSTLSPFASTDLDDFCNSNREEGKNVVAKPESHSKNDENGSKLDKTSQDTVNQGASDEEVPKVSQSVSTSDRDKMKAEVATKLTNGTHVEKTVPHTTEIKTIIVNGIIEETSFD